MIEDGVGEAFEGHDLLRREFLAGLGFGLRVIDEIGFDDVDDDGFVVGIAADFDGFDFVGGEGAFVAIIGFDDPGGLDFGGAVDFDDQIDIGQSGVGAALAAGFVFAEVTDAEDVQVGLFQDFAHVISGEALIFGALLVAAAIGDAFGVAVEGDQADFLGEIIFGFFDEVEDVADAVWLEEVETSGIDHRNGEIEAEIVAQALGFHAPFDQAVALECEVDAADGSGHFEAAPIAARAQVDEEIADQHRLGRAGIADPRRGFAFGQKAFDHPILDDELVEVGEEALLEGKALQRFRTISSGFPLLFEPVNPVQILLVPLVRHCRSPTACVRFFARLR